MATVPSPKINTFFKERKQNKISLVMNIFYRIQIPWGFDYGFFNFKSSVANMVTKILLLTICASLVTSVFYYYPIAEVQNYMWLYIFLAKYIFSVLFLVTLNTKSTLRSFHFDLQAIDSKVGFDCASFHLEHKVILYSILCISCRVSFGLIYWLAASFYLKPFYIALFYVGALSNVDILLVSYAFIFYAVNCRLKKLTAILKHATYDFSSHMHTNKLYVDLVEKYKRAFDPLQIIALITTVPEVMLIIFNFITLKNTINSAIYILDNVWVIEALSLALAPSVFAGMLATQAERMKLLLHDKLLDEEDSRCVTELEMFIGYLEARPCRFRVYKVIPLDADLLLMVFNFCVTYLIVILQFTLKS